jgi:branched-chain amino acid transport system substrate-binding protein
MADNADAVAGWIAEAEATPVVVAIAAGPDRTGETIKIGVVAQDAGFLPFPQMTAATEVAIDKINNEGGIHGATLEAVYCSVELSPASTINCANQMVEEGVVFVYITLDFVADAGLPIYQEAGIPFVSSSSTGPGQESAESGVFIMHHASLGSAVGAYKLLSDLGITKVTQSHGLNPASQNFAVNISGIAAAVYGMDVQYVTVNEQAPDFAALIATAQANGSEAIFTVTSEHQCNALITAARAGGFDGPIVAGICTYFVSELGADAVGVYTVLPVAQPDTIGGSVEVQARLTEYQTLMVDAGYEQFSGGDQGVWSFGVLQELRSVLERIEGDITSESFEETISQDVVIPGWFGPDMNCGVSNGLSPQFAAHCSDSVSTWVVEEVDGENRRVQIDDFFDISEAIG